MTSVWYIGRAHVRAIYADQWATAGFPDKQSSQWDQSNGWSLPAASFSAAQLALLDADDEFNVAGTDGPRPGSAVIQNPYETASRSWVMEQLTGFQSGSGSTLVLGPLDPVPANTPAGTVIFRTT